MRNIPLSGSQGVVMATETGCAPWFERYSIMAMLLSRRTYNARLVDIVAVIRSWGDAGDLAATWVLHRCDSLGRCVSATCCACQVEDVSQVLKPDQRACPNSYRLMKSPITRSCMRSVLEKHSVRRTSRLIRVYGGKAGAPARHVAMRRAKTLYTCS
jgi:hypothetical protein